MKNEKLKSYSSAKSADKLFRTIALTIAIILLFIIASVMAGTVIYILTELYLWLNS